MTPTLALALAHIAPAYSAREHTRAAERMVQDMEKNTHTPGPWTWNGEYQASGSRHTWSLIGGNGYGILSCDGDANSPQGLGDEANARLIAASPDLLAALEDALPTLQSHMERYPNDKDERRIYDAARAAIDKARGK